MCCDVKWLEEIVEHAKLTLPDECCGIIDTNMTVFRIHNRDESPITFTMDPEGQLKAFGVMELYGTSVYAIYHSHPYAVAYPSERDVQMAVMGEWTDAFHIIISPMAFEPTVRMFRIDTEGHVEEV